MYKCFFFYIKVTIVYRLMKNTEMICKSLCFLFTSCTALQLFGMETALSSTSMHLERSQAFRIGSIFEVVFSSILF